MTSIFLKHSALRHGLAMSAAGLLLFAGAATAQVISNTTGSTTSAVTEGTKRSS
jgi:hypothetical protein